MAASLRRTVTQIAAAIAGGKFLHAIQFLPADLKKGTFFGKVTTSDAGAGVSTNPVVTFVAGPKGGPKVYKDVDTLVKEVLALAPANTTCKVTDIDADDYISTTPINPVKAAKSEVKKLTTAITRAGAYETSAEAYLLQIAGFDGGTTAEQALYDEAVAAAETITADKALMAARKATLETFIAANGG
jgi:hypothetical protein